MSEAPKSEEPDPLKLEEQLSQALEDVDLYKNKLAATDSLLEEAEELLDFTWEQVETAEEVARQNADAASRAGQLEEDKARLQREFQDFKASTERQLFEKALDLAVRKAKRYERGLAVLVFPRLEAEGEEERVAQVLRDSDMFGRLDDSTYGVIIEEDLPHHDIGECIERLEGRIGRHSASSILGVDSDEPQRLIAIAVDALSAILSRED